MSRRVFVLQPNPHPARKNAVQTILDAPDGYCVTVGPQQRTTEQNARLWASLTDISQQVIWHGRRLTAENWKHVFTASLRKLDVVPNLDGTGFVALGLSTSSMTRRELSDLLDLIGAFGADRGVVWSETEEVAA